MAESFIINFNESDSDQQKQNSGQNKNITSLNCSNSTNNNQFYSLNFKAERIQKSMFKVQDHQNQYHQSKIFSKQQQKYPFHQKISEKIFLENSQTKNNQSQLQNQQQSKNILISSGPMIYQQDIQQLDDQKNEANKQLKENIQQDSQKISIPKTFKKDTYFNSTQNEKFSQPNSPTKLLNKKNHNNYFSEVIQNQIPQGHCIQVTIKRQNTLFGLYPIYTMLFEKNQKFMMCAKKISNTISPTFIISSNKDNMQQNGIFYLGKVKLNFLGTVCNIFGRGFNPENAQQYKLVPRQLCVTVIYINQLLANKGQPKQIVVYLKKPQFSYYSLMGVQMYSQQRSLEDLYQYSQNQQKITVFRTRKPAWNEQIKGYSLNFRGRVKEPSVKNFILEKKENNNSQGQQVLLFGKLQNNIYNMQISHPLNPFLAFGIVLTTFGLS